MLRDSEIGSCRVRSVVPVGATGSSGWVGGVVTSAGVGCLASSKASCWTAGYKVAGYRLPN